jgi:hypothetical protein
MNETGPAHKITDWPLKRYASSPLSQRLSENSSIDADTYDWALNDAPAGS